MTPQKDFFRWMSKSFNSNSQEEHLLDNYSETSQDGHNGDLDFTDPYQEQYSQDNNQLNSKGLNLSSHINKTLNQRLLDLDRVPKRIQNWIIIDKSGQINTLSADKRRIQQLYGLKVNIRDLRLLDFELQSQDKKTILVRENAIVFAVEHIRLLVTSEKALLLDDGDKKLMARTQLLVEKISKVLMKQQQHPQLKNIGSSAISRKPSKELLDNLNANSSTPRKQTMMKQVSDTGGKQQPQQQALLTKQLQQQAAVPQQKVQVQQQQIQQAQQQLQLQYQQKVQQLQTLNQQQSIPMEEIHLLNLDKISLNMDNASLMEYESSDEVENPFEFRILEFALSEVCSILQVQVEQLTSELNTRINFLMRQVNTKNLKAMKKAKAQHIKLSSRVQTLRDFIQRILDDENDMHMMCLSVNDYIRQQQSIIQKSHGGSNGGDQVAQSQPIVPRFTPLYKQSFHRSANIRQNIDYQVDKLEDEQEIEGISQQEIDILQQCGYLQAETLLESFFVEVDSWHQRLENFEEEIEDTEEYITLQMSTTRNDLVKLEITMTAATFALSIWGVVAGVLGENLSIPRYITQHAVMFIILNLGLFGLSILIFLSIVFYIKNKILE